eukprot:TRINITY_DN20664_c0_g1_i1.p1 TRINITY_DN20664_c0_g1~~TRINITY_DN20664_c0_g1_i1.p1  ORF type:complete len:228 (+),score=33.60 TRINITY_DN20664_c0_g1_i1:146-829(+)
MAEVDKLSRLFAAVVLVLVLLQGAMVAMALGIDWHYIVIDQDVDRITISDLTERDVEDHKWTRYIYERCVSVAAATQLGGSVTTSDCERVADHDDCAENLRWTGHAVAAFTILSFIFLVFALVAAIVAFFLPVPPSLHVALQIVVVVMTILAWAPYVAYRYGQIPSCSDRNDSPWCPDDATKCRYYGFGFMLAVTCLCIAGAVAFGVMRAVLVRTRASAAAVAQTKG